jgi:hypothetical protein
LLLSDFFSARRGYFSFPFHGVSRDVSHYTASVGVSAGKKGESVHIRLYINIIIDAAFLAFYFLETANNKRE